MDGKAAEIESLNADVEGKAAEIEALNADVEGKAAEIEALNADVEGKAAEIEALNADVEGKAAEIEALNADVDGKAAEIEALNADVEGKASEIEALNADVEGKAAQIEALNADVDGKAAQIEALNADVEGKASEIEALNADVDGKAAQIEALTQELDDLNAQIQEEYEIQNVIAEGDASFLKDMASALSARWEISGTDTSMMSKRKQQETKRSLVEAELRYLNKYNEYTFEDPLLGEYAQAYLHALNNQYIAVEYMGEDEDLYTQYWTTDGMRVRFKYIYLINYEFGLEMPEKDMETLTSTVADGAYYNCVIDLENTLDQQLRDVVVTHDQSTTKDYLYIAPFKLNNPNSFNIDDVFLKIHFMDDNDTNVAYSYLVGGDTIAHGKFISTDKAMTSYHFSRIEFSYSCNITANGKVYRVENRIVPTHQYSWNGQVQKVDPKNPHADQPILELKNITTSWDTNKSWGQSLYVPVLKFNVVNSGTADASKVTVHCVFLRKDTKEIWSEETTYVIGSSDAALKPGYSKKGFVYSTVGYPTKPSVLPDLVAEIYINDQLIKTVSISK